MMKRVIVGTLSLLALLPCSAISQHFTTAEQEVLDLSKKCWAAWSDAVQKKDLSIWLDTCRPADDLAGWWTTEGALWGLEAERRSFLPWAQRIKAFTVENVQPLRIRVEGDHALMWFYAIYTIEEVSGRVTRSEDKRFEVFRRDAGVWRWTGGMVSTTAIGNPGEEKK
jgi:ketosteroid isomerase-like protein